MMANVKCMAESCQEKSSNAYMMSCFGDCGGVIHPACAGFSRSMYSQPDKAQLDHYLVFCCESCRGYKDTMQASRQLTDYVTTSQDDFKQMRKDMMKLQLDHDRMSKAFGELQESVTKSESSSRFGINKVEKLLAKMSDELFDKLSSIDNASPCIPRSELKQIVTSAIQSTNSDAQHGCITEHLLMRVLKEQLDSALGGLSLAECSGTPQEALERLSNDVEKLGAVQCPLYIKKVVSEALVEHLVRPSESLSNELNQAIDVEVQNGVNSEEMARIEDVDVSTIARVEIDSQNVVHDVNVGKNIQTKSGLFVMVADIKKTKKMKNKSNKKRVKKNYVEVNAVSRAHTKPRKSNNSKRSDRGKVARDVAAAAHIPTHTRSSRNQMPPAVVGRYQAVANLYPADVGRYPTVVGYHPSAVVNSAAAVPQRLEMNPHSGNPFLPAALIHTMPAGHTNRNGNSGIRKRWVHLSGVSLNSTENDIANYVSRKLKSANVQCFLLNGDTMNAHHTTASFKVGVDENCFPVLLNQNFWPVGVKVREFLPQRRQNFYAGMVPPIIQ